MFDPTEAYKRIDEADVIDPKGYNSVYAQRLIFPKRNDGLCLWMQVEIRRKKDCLGFLKIAAIFRS